MLVKGSDFVYAKKFMSHSRPFGKGEFIGALVYCPSYIWYISVSICQNTFSLFFLKNELEVFLESLGPFYGHCRFSEACKIHFCKCLPIAFPSVTICQNTFQSQKHLFIAFGLNRICQNTFPLQNTDWFAF